MLGYTRHDPPLLTAEDVADAKLSRGDRKRREAAERRAATAKSIGAIRNAGFEATVALTEAIEKLK